MGDHRLPKRVKSGELENVGWGKGEIMDGLRGRGSSCLRRHEGLEHRRTRPWGLVQHSTRRGL